MNTNTPNDISNDFKILLDALYQSLEFVERTVTSFRDIFALDIRGRAKGVDKKLKSVVDLYFYGTVDAEDDLISAFDKEFSELEYLSRDFSSSLNKLTDSLNKLSDIYDQSILEYTIVIMVSSLEVFLSNTFTLCLKAKFQQNDRAVSEIRSRYNFQNWGSSVEAYQTFLGVDFSTLKEFSSAITILQQKRHIIIHQSGVVDVKAAKYLNLPASAIGTRINIAEVDVSAGVGVVRNIAKYLYSAALKLTDGK